jgi:hypothetical protein
MSGLVKFAAPLPLVHTGGTPKRVYATVSTLPQYRVQLSSTAVARKLGGDSLLLEPVDETLINCPAQMECAERLTVGDEVLVSFLGQDRGQPRVIGWRREPKDCGGRPWVQIR